MESLQTLLLFATGFLLSRVMIKARLPQKLVRLFMGHSHNSLSITVLYLLTTTALVSLFIPNAVAMLALLPVLELLNRAFQDENSKVPTMLTLAVLYGANIGGMGSITGSPTNLVLIGYLKANQVAGVDNITFLNWMLWGIPLVIILVLMAWIILAVGFKAWHVNAARVHMPFAPSETEHPLQHKALAVVIAYIITALLSSYLLLLLPDHGLIIMGTMGLAALGMVWYLFVYKIADGETGQPFLSIADTYSDLPIRGLEWIAIVIVLASVLYLAGAQEWLTSYAPYLLPKNLSPYWLLLAAAMITTFATEVFSNTMVQIAMFLVMLPLTLGLGMSPIPALLIVTLTCNCAFMTPIATPVNALAFGSVRGISLWYFMAVGAVMNIASAIFITFYVLKFATLTFS